MNPSTTRLAAASLSLAVIWIAVYWWWEPREGRITFAKPPAPRPPDPQPAPARVEPRPDPVPTPPEPPRIEPAPAASPKAEPPKPEPSVIPPTFETYIVQQGDTFASISRKVFGTGAYATKIAESNPFVSPDRLRPGREIRIPKDPANIQGVPNPRAPLQAPAPEAVPADREYTVRPGDTLSVIAQREYGSTSFVEFIIQANRDRLPNPDLIREGQKLRLPPKPADRSGGR